MIDKRFVETFLRLNHVSASTSPTEVRAVLTKAHWPQADIEEALFLQRGGDASARAAIENRHKPTFRPDMHWSSSTLSSLLGVDVVIDPQSFRMPASTKAQLASMSKKIFVGFCIAAVSVAVSAALGMGLMYLFEIGPFYTNTHKII